MEWKNLRISYCIVCMNRIDHLKSTLKVNLKDTKNDQNVEFVLLDYNSSDGMGEWVKNTLQSEIESGRLLYFRTEDPQEFSHSHSKNMAFKLASGDILCSINADHYIGEGFSDYLRDKFGGNQPVFVSPQVPQNYKSAWRPPTDVFGKIALRKIDFKKTTGFDERFKGYGFEDIDFVNRLSMLKVKRIVLDQDKYCRFISHGEDRRYTIKTPPFDELYVSYVKHEFTKALLVYGNNFQELLLERRLFSNADDFRSAYNKRIVVAAFEIRWKKNGTLYKKGGKITAMKYSDNEEWNCQVKKDGFIKTSIYDKTISEEYSKIDSQVLASKLNSNLLVLNNWYLTKENRHNKKTDVNKQFGAGRVSKNFQKEVIHV